ncbi:MAG: ATP-grasp domain-containing protein [Clostridia bacterium]|nr:ATP-grasp domain-containing protein [Clostridia bacterium]
MGLTVAVADQNPKAVGIPYADVYYKISTVDEQGIYEAARDFGADGIITLATDMPMRAVAYACERLGTCGIDYETAVRSTDKGEMIKAFAAAALPIPRYALPENAKDAVNLGKTLNFPLICKPIDNSGSRGVTLVCTPEELPDAVSYSSQCSPAGKVILEEYLVGREVSAEVVIWQGEATVLAVTDKLTTGAPHFVETGHSQPSRLSDSDVETVKKLAKDAVKAVGIRMGTAHVEIMVTSKGAYLIELGARMGGDCITTHLVPLSTGIDMIKANINIALGIPPKITPRFSRGAAIRYVLPEKGVIKSIEGVQTAECMSGVKCVEIMKRAGETVEAVRNSTDRLGFVITQADTAEQAVAIANAASAVIRTVR